ncbi:hypothetical protein IJG93_01720 [Candidatus Saccharibacteria bacterium]|nr:hypothetical protein [Candidatus Saccharibacteria bacterium]
MAKKHSSFKRSYREDYVRELEVPGMGQHIFQSFKMIIANWKIFLPLLVIMTVVTVLILGFLNFSSMKDVAVGTVVTIIILTVWLATIFVIRHKMAGNKIGLRDTLYNAMTPFLSSFVVLTLVVIQAIPIMLLIIAYSSAIETQFLETPFYAFLFLVFAGLMILLTSYLWSGTLMALVAVSAPGLYPFEAIKTANELMMGRRIRFVLRIIALFIVLFVIWALTIWPMAVFVGESPVTSVVLTIVGCFSVIYIATYLYLYYRWMLKFDTKKEKNGKKRGGKKNS